MLLFYEQLFFAERRRRKYEIHRPNKLVDIDAPHIQTDTYI